MKYLKDLTQSNELPECITIGDTAFKIKYSRSCPRLSETEYNNLKEDIRRRGVVVPIIIDDTYTVIDGEHRLRACKELGITQIPFQVRPGLDETQKWEMAQDLNLHRRHLTQEQIAKLISENKKNLPQMALNLRKEGKSLRQIGEEIGVSHPQAKKLIEKAGGNNLPPVVKGKDGKTYLAKAPSINTSSLKDAEKAVNAIRLAGTGNLPNRAIDLKQATKIANRVQREQRRCQPVSDIQAGTLKLLSGDFNVRGQEIPDNSIDLIQTDLPYDKESLLLWEQLGLLGKRVLKPGGILISYSGNLYLPEVLTSLQENLTYLWTASIVHNGRTKIMHPVCLNQAWKPVVIFYKPPLKRFWPAINDLYAGGKQEKDQHEWQQSIDESLYFIKNFCPVGGSILDPCLGSGTTLDAALRSGMGLNCIGTEIDNDAYLTAQERLFKTQNELKDKKNTA